LNTDSLPLEMSDMLLKVLGELDNDLVVKVLDFFLALEKLVEMVFHLYFCFVEARS